MICTPHQILFGWSNWDEWFDYFDWLPCVMLAIWCIKRDWIQVHHDRKEYRVPAKTITNYWVL